MRRSLFLGLALLVAACSGSLIRSNTLLPAMITSWAAIQAQVEREAVLAQIDVAPQVVKVNESLANNDPITFATVNWTLLDGLANSDINRRLNAGQLGTVAAGSLRERLLRWAEARATYLRQP